MTTILFLLLLLLVLRSLGRPAAGPARAPVGPWSGTGGRIAADVVAGVRVLDRLSVARRDRIGRPWS
ncbi:hypothetical protein [Blastococcus montanus]|uniref:hypothetical protein n=1 Tax=Blastococcus montanus TaxID=3144973 RepID=UPI0032092BF3